MLVFLPVDRVELFRSDAVSPVTRCGSGGIDARIGAVSKQILNRQYDEVGVAPEHGTDHAVKPAAPIGVGITAVVEHLSTRLVVKLPQVSEQGIVVVRSRIGDAVLRIVVRKMGGFGIMPPSPSGQRQRVFPC